MAAVLQMSESTVSRIKNDEMPRVIQLLAAAGLRVIESDRVCVKREEWALVTKIAARALANEQTAMHILFEDADE